MWGLDLLKTCVRPSAHLTPPPRWTSSISGGASHKNVSTLKTEQCWPALLKCSSCSGRLAKSRWLAKIGRKSVPQTVAESCVWGACKGSHAEQCRPALLKCSSMATDIQAGLASVTTRACLGVLQCRVWACEDAHMLNNAGQRCSSVRVWPQTFKEAWQV